MRNELNLLLIFFPFANYYFVEFDYPI